MIAPLYSSERLGMITFFFHVENKSYKNIYICAQVAQQFSLYIKVYLYTEREPFT